MLKRKNRKLLESLNDEDFNDRVAEAMLTHPTVVAALEYQVLNILAAVYDEAQALREQGKSAEDAYKTMPGTGQYL